MMIILNVFSKLSPFKSLLESFHCTMVNCITLMWELSCYISIYISTKQCIGQNKHWHFWSQTESPKLLELRGNTTSVQIGIWTDATPLLKTWASRYKFCQSWLHCTYYVKSHSACVKNSRHFCFSHTLQDSQIIKLCWQEMAEHYSSDSFCWECQLSKSQTNTTTRQHHLDWPWLIQYNKFSH